MTPIPEEFGRPMIEAAKAYQKRFVNQGGPTRYASDDFQAGAEWAYRLLSDQGLRWVSVDERKPDTVGDTDWSLNVLAICDGKLMVMSYGYIDGEGEESGWVWANCYGDINGDSEWDGDYSPTHWMPLPQSPAPIQ